MKTIAILILLAICISPVFAQDAQDITYTNSYTITISGTTNSVIVDWTSTNVVPTACYISNNTTNGGASFQIDDAGIIAPGGWYNQDFPNVARGKRVARPTNGTSVSIGVRMEGR